MITIKRLNCFDAPKIKKMIEYLGSDEKFSRDITAEAFLMLHAVLPLKYKFLPESYVLLDNDEILGDAPHGTMTATAPVIDYISIETKAQLGAFNAKDNGEGENAVHF